MIVLLLCMFLLSPVCLARNSQLDQDFDLETHLLLNQLNAEDEVTTRGEELPLPEIACISIGARWSAALAFRRRSISTAYYPFDFIATPLHGLHILLKTKFRSFLNKGLLKPTRKNNAWLDQNTDSPDQQKPMAKAEQMVVVENSLTGCEFIHDFKDNKMSNYTTVAQKYQRRIDRFYRTIAQAKRVYFFRTFLSKQEAADLHALLRSLFPTTDFTLVAPTSPERAKQPWRLEGVKEFLMYSPEEKLPAYKVHGSGAAWDHMFKTLNLI